MMRINFYAPDVPGNEVESEHFQVLRRSRRSGASETGGNRRRAYCVGFDQDARVCLSSARL